MIDLQSLLTFPITSDAFTELESDDVELADDDDDGLASPLRKVARLDSGSDSASASRSSGHQNSRTRPREGPIIIQILGDPIEPPSETVHNQNYGLVKRCIKTLLTRIDPENLPATYEKIYRTCQFVVTVSKRGEGLYDNLRLELEQCVGGLANDLILDRSDATQWMAVFVQHCGWFEAKVSLIKSLLTYLDQSYVARDTKLLSISDLASSLFFSRIFQHPKIVDHLRLGTHQWITAERVNRGEHEMRRFIKELVSHLVLHDQYHPLFESFFIDVTQSFYVEESTEYAVSFKNQAHLFLTHVNTRVEEEVQRCMAVLPKSSWSTVEMVTEKALMDGRLEWLATEALGPFMDARDFKEIAILYCLFARVDGLKVLSAAFKAHVITTVQNIIKDPALDDDMVQRLLDFKAVANSIVTDVFVDQVSHPSSASGEASTSHAGPSTNTSTTNHNQFSYALIDAFQTGFKARRNKPAEMIAKYMDKAMREPNRDASDNDFAKRMDAVLALYRFTEDKDVFRTFYHRALAKRLLLGRSASDDDEKMMLKKLKEQYDPEFGMGDHMFNDLALSREMMAEYHSKHSDDLARKLSVMVLQQSFWPFAPRKTTVDLPPTMQVVLSSYVSFYKKKHQGRKLEWDHALGTMILRAQFDAGSKELSVSLYQGIVLLLFNDVTELSFWDIWELTRIDEAELRRTLQSLACGKKRVLKKSPVGRDVHDADIFRFNADFTDPRSKVHINSIQVKETPEESRRTQNSVEGDRKYYLDAAIVRIMKARKELSYEHLKLATIDAVKNHFVPEVSSIKERVQVLVEQEYLKRDDEDMNMYIYVA